jgi:hypothetical protein
MDLKLSDIAGWHLNTTVLCVLGHTSRGNDQAFYPNLRHIDVFIAVTMQSDGHVAIVGTFSSANLYKLL